MKAKQKKSKMELPRRAYAGVVVNDTGFTAVVIADGTSRVHEEHGITTSAISRKISSWLTKTQRKHHIKIVGIGLVEKEGWEREQLGSLLWLKQDIVPHLLPALEGKKKERAYQAAQTVAEKYSGFLAQVSLNSDREVVPSFLTEGDDFKTITPKREFHSFLRQIRKFKKSGGKIVFFSSTPAGGGVALMRHALMRLFRLFGVDAHWYVLIPREAVFEITKRKFHNVLQAIAPKNMMLSRRDKRTYANWIEENAKIFQTVFKRASVVVIDDPQPSGLIPFIKAENPNVKIIYRSHIELRTDLMAKKGTHQQDTWNFLKDAIHQADVFVSHPIAAFVPQDIPKKKVVFMPATTDPLDGLNKQLSAAQSRYYQKIFNQVLAENGQSPLSLTRPYIIQVARFDPSKGISDVIEAYHRLRKRLADIDMPKSEIPQLVITGNGAIDDPEGNYILQEILFLLDIDRYRDIANDIKVVRVPHIDQMLNALLAGSMIALQLSHREGFEVKVTEALKKGRPVIAYRTGGIPLQIRQGITGCLVRTGDTKKVTEHLYNLIVDKSLYATFLKHIGAERYDKYGTVANATRWLFLANELAVEGTVSGRGRSVDTLLDASL